MYNYLIKIIPTTLKFIPVYILLKINVTLICPRFK